MYKILITERALKDLNSLDQSARRKLVLKLKEYSSSPFKYARKLINPKIGMYRFRIGKYRVIFDIENEHIIVLRIGHRRDIYK